MVVIFLVLATLSVWAGPEVAPKERIGGRSWKGEASIYAVDFDPNGQRLLALDINGGVLALDLASGRVAPLIPPDRLEITAIATSPDGASIAAGDLDGVVTVRDAATGQVRATVDRAAPGCAGPPGVGPSQARTRGSISALAYSRDGRVLAVGAADGSIRLWDVGDRHLLGHFRGHAGRVNQFSFGSEGRLFASWSSDGTAKVWDRADGRCVRTVAHGASLVLGVALAPDEGRMAVSLHGGGVPREGSVLVVDLGTDPRPDRRLDGFGAVGLAFSPDGRNLVGVGVESLVQVYDLAEGRVVVAAEGRSCHYRDVVFHPGGRMVATTASDGSVGFFEIPGRGTTRGTEACNGDEDNFRFAISADLHPR